MSRLITAWLVSLVVFGCCTLAFSQGTAQSPTEETQATPSAATETQEKNVEEYIELLRTNVRQQKDQIMGAVMELDVDQAKKFWPIYEEYDAELTKLNKLRAANVLDYAQGYGQMTDAKADDLTQKGLNYQKERFDLLAKYYARVKASLGAMQAARFIQIENQLLMIIDLQIASSLPTEAQGS
jgi:hypothetical protein